VCVARLDRQPEQDTGAFTLSRLDLELTTE
jgi:hypothetical protein